MFVRSKNFWLIYHNFLLLFVWQNNKYIFGSRGESDGLGGGGGYCRIEKQKLEIGIDMKCMKIKKYLLYQIMK